MYFVATAILTISLAINSIAAYLRNFPQNLTQPDGRTILCYATGDEFSNWLHDANGYLIVKDQKTGFFVYASEELGRLTPTPLVVGSSDPDPGLIKRGAPDISESMHQSLKKPYDRPQSAAWDSLDWYKYAPSLGTLNNLVVLIRFSDSPEYDCTKAFLDSTFNQRNPVPLYSWVDQSIWDWFDLYSLHQCDVRSTFYPQPENQKVISYQDAHPRGYYQSINIDPIGYATGDERLNREHPLLKRAIDAIKGQVPADLNIDQNNDGFVDNVLFLLYGYYGGAPDFGDILGAHQNRLWSQEAFINGKKVWMYDIYAYHPGRVNQKINISTVIHEMLHSMGAVELTHPNILSTDWICPIFADLMGPWYSGVCVYTKWRYLHWIKDIPVITTSGSYALKPLNSTDHYAYKILSPNSTTEYFLLEYRRSIPPFESENAGADEGLVINRINTLRDGRGDLEWPPDEVYTYRYNGTISTQGALLHTAFSAASGRSAFNDTTNPSCFLSDGSPGGLDIKNISDPGDSITFYVTIPGTEVADNGAGKQVMFQLGQNYPNPFNGATVIRYILPLPGQVRLDVLNIKGERVKRLADGFEEAGSHQIFLNSDNMSSGIYFYTIVAGKYIATKKLLLLK